MWTILFDIDGTLIRTEGAGMSAIERAMRELFAVTQIPKVKLGGRTDYGIISDLFRPFGIDVDANIEPFKRLYWEYLPSSLHEREGCVLPGVLDLLEHLTQMEHCELGIITGNTKRSAKIKLEHFGLDHFFAFGGYGDAHSDRNDVAMLAKNSAAEALGEKFDPVQVCVIGDTVNDVRCARSIQSRVVAVETGGVGREELALAEPDLLLNSLADYQSFLIHFGLV